LEGEERAEVEGSKGGGLNWTICKGRRILSSEEEKRRSWKK